MAKAKILATIAVFASIALAGTASAQGLVGNSFTGPGSFNRAMGVMDNDVNVINRNYSDIDNNFSVYSNTGNNVVSGFGPQAIKTGDSVVSIGVDNSANSNLGAIPFGLGFGIPELGVANQNTGCGSWNDTGLFVDNDFNLVNDNYFHPVNNIGVYSNTGGNFGFSRPFGCFGCGSGSEMITGDSAVNLNIANHGNTGLF